jgi:hypothetical protein
LRFRQELPAAFHIGRDLGREVVMVLALWGCIGFVVVIGMTMVVSHFAVQARRKVT